MDYKIYTHEIHSSYAARLDNFRSYDTISKDIIQRWTFPFVPDVMSAIRLERQGMYRASGKQIYEGVLCISFFVIWVIENKSLIGTDFINFVLRHHTVT